MELKSFKKIKWGRHRQNHSARISSAQLDLLNLKFGVRRYTALMRVGKMAKRRIMAISDAKYRNKLRRLTSGFKTALNTRNV